jgi:uncharacterized protein
MKCPRCNAEMTEVPKHGVMIDHCALCGGIWLDKGELAKIMAQLREAKGALDQEFHPSRQNRELYDREHSYHGEHHDEGHHDGEHYGKYNEKQHYRKKSAFGRLFDIFD